MNTKIGVISWFDNLKELTIPGSVRKIGKEGYHILLEVACDSTWDSVVASGIQINEHNYADLNKLVNECVETLNTREDVEALNLRKDENTRTQYEEINLKKLEMENWKKETVVFLEK